MKKIERQNIYKYLCSQPKFFLMPERYQEALNYMADGYTDQELSKMYNISHGTPWFYREATLKRLGFKVYEPERINRHTSGPTRAMTMEEVKVNFINL